MGLVAGYKTQVGGSVPLATGPSGEGGWQREKRVPRKNWSGPAEDAVQLRTRSSPVEDPVQWRTRSSGGPGPAVEPVQARGGIERLQRRSRSGRGAGRSEATPKLGQRVCVSVATRPITNQENAEHLRSRCRVGLKKPARRLSRGSPCE